MTDHLCVARRSLALAATLGFASFAACAGDRTVPIPFEVDRAQLRGDRYMLKLNDDAAAIPAARIQSLPVVDGRIGDRAELDHGLLVYFPYGTIVRAEMRIQKFRTDGDAASGPDPVYRLVKDFDKALGPVCASMSDAGQPGHVVEMRIASQKVISVVERVPQPGIGAAADTASYRVLSTLNVTYLADLASANAMYDTCTHKRGRMATN
jgi:hypothetical protein